MITENKIKLYNKYSGDIDGWARNSSKKELSIMSDDDWFLIDGFIQDLTLVKKGLASVEFSISLNNKLKENCDTDETINRIKKILTNNDDYENVSIEHNNFLSILKTIHQLLQNSGNYAQAEFIKNLIELIYQNNFSLFIKLINGADMWGGSGAVWEVYIENKNEVKSFEKLMLSLIDLMEKTKILGKGIKRIKRIFEKNSKKND